MLLAECTVLLLPLDVGNSLGATGCGPWNNWCSGGVDMPLLWQIAYCTIAALVVLVMPFFIFYYESDDEGMEVAEKAEDCMSALRLHAVACKRNLLSACCYTSIIAILGIALFLILYNFIAFTQIPYKLQTASVATTAFQPVGTPYIVANTAGGCPLGAVCPCGAYRGCTPINSTLVMNVTVVVFMASLMCFLGWFIFSIYVGIGFVAMPIDLVYSFINRPKMLSASDARNQKRVLMNKSKDLIAMGEEMAEKLFEATESARGRGAVRKAQREHKEDLKRFRLLVDQVERELDDFQMGDPASYREHYNPLVPYVSLLCGAASAVLTLVWVLHIIIYMLFTPPLYGFLNVYLRQLDGFFPLFSTLTIGIMSVYLLLAASKGAAKFGTRFLLVSVHPLEKGKTLLNSFIFNVQLVLLCVLPTVQFSTNAFNAYAVYTSATVIFGTQMNYIQGFRFFFQYNVFLFMLLGFFGLSCIYFVRCRGARPCTPPLAHHCLTSAPPPLFSRDAQGLWPSDKKHLDEMMKKIKTKKRKEGLEFERKLDQKGGALSLV